MQGSEVDGTSQCAIWHRLWSLLAGDFANLTIVLIRIVEIMMGETSNEDMEKGLYAGVFSDTPVLCCVSFGPEYKKNRSQEIII